MHRAILASVLVVFPGAAWAQDDREAPPAVDVIDPADVDRPRAQPVMVNARRWSELLQNVPQSVSVLDRQTLEDAGIRSIREASFLVPNLHMTEFSARRLSFPTIRGISTGVGDPSVTTYIDGVPQLDVSSTNIGMLNVDRLEFLRGPQSTLFGRNSNGGVILIETERPSNTQVIGGSTTWGNFDLQEHSLFYSGPLQEDRWFINLSGMYSERDGYTENDITGNHVDDRRSTFGRGKILFTPDDRNEFEFTMYNERARDGGFALGFLDDIRMRPHHIAEDFEGKSDRDIWSNALTWNHFGDEIDVTSVTSYVDWEISEESDFDFSPLDGIRRFTDEEQQYFYQEVRIATPEGADIELNDNARLRWLVGGALFASDGMDSAANEFRPGGAGILFPPAMVGTVTDTGDFDDLGVSVFGQAVITFNDRLEFGAGLRYDYEDRDADITNMFESGGFVLFSSSRSESESFDELSPSFSLSYDLNDDAMVYGRIAKGFKAGGFNLVAPSGSEVFDTETSWSYEAGLKTTWFDDRLIFNTSVFFIDWDDLQLSLFDMASGGYTANAGEATSTGVELEMLARVCENVDLFAGFGYTDAEFDEFTDQFGMDQSGSNLAFVPETTFTAGAQVRGKLGGGLDWFARGEYVNIGTYYLDAGNTEDESFGLTNFRLGVECGNVRIEGWVRNAFDDEYVLVAFQPSPFDPTTFVGENGAPRTFGVTASIRY